MSSGAVSSLTCRIRCPIRFPSAHRLGVPRSTVTLKDSFPVPGYHHTNLDAATLVEDATSDGVDEVDFDLEGSEARKRKRSSSGSLSSVFKYPRKGSLQESPALAPVPSVLTHDGHTLKEFGLYIPKKLPRSILEDHSALCSYILSGAGETFLTIQDYNQHLDIMDLRLPPSLAIELGSDTSFISKLLFTTLSKLRNITSIQHLLLPTIYCVTSTDQLISCISPLDQCRVSQIDTISLPVTDANTRLVASKTTQKLISLFQNVDLKELQLTSAHPNALAALQKSLRETAQKIGYHLNITSQAKEEDPFFLHEIEDDDQGMIELEDTSPETLVCALNVSSTSGTSELTNPVLGPKLARDHRKHCAKSAYLSDRFVSKKAANELSPDNPFVSNIWELERLHNSGIDGEGTTIAVIDSGINYLHPAFKDKIYLVKNFVPERLNDFDSIIDSDGHGSLCAGIAAAASFYCPSDPESKTSGSILVPPGVAPKAKMIICKVVDAGCGEADNKAIIAALEWLKDLLITGTRIDIVSISLAASYFSKRQADLISELTTLGAIVVCCASNEGRMRFKPISFPGRLGQVLCIGAHDDNGKPTSFSPVGREIDFLGPGLDIWGPGPGTVGPFAMDCASGTSCATPAVAGLVCLVLHRVRRMQQQHPRKYQINGRPVLECVHNVWAMRELLREMSSSPGHHSEEIGHGTLDPHRLLDRNDDELFRLIDSIVEDE